MNTGIISQIQKITGVKTVEPAGKDMAVVVFEGQKPLFMTEDGIETFDGEKYWFVNKNSKDPIALSSVAQSFDLVDSNIRFSTLKAAEDWIASRKQKQKEAELIKGAEKRGLIDGAKYKWDNNRWIHLPERIIKYPLYVNSKGDLCDFMSNIISTNGEWPTVITEPKSLKPEDLVEGQIYFAESKCHSCSSIFRHKYNNLNSGGYINTSVSRVYEFQPIRPATLEEKQKLVKAEVNNDFYFGLK